MPLYIIQANIDGKWYAMTHYEPELSHEKAAMKVDAKMKHSKFAMRVVKYEPVEVIYSPTE